MRNHPQETVEEERLIQTEKDGVSPEKRKRRLDEILVAEGLISDAQIQEALLRQKAYGGRFGSQLLCLGYLDEAGLVRALSTQLGCPGIVLSDLKIPQRVIGMVPKEVVLARRVIPFEYDPQGNVLKIACEDPTDSELIKELDFVVRGREIELRVAVEIALNTAIAKYYAGRDLSWHDAHLLETFGPTADEGQQPVGTQPDRPGDAGPAVLLMIDQEQTLLALRSLLERDNYRVVVARSPDEAIGLVANQRFHTIFLNHTGSFDQVDFISRVRRISPETVIRHYEKASSLLLGEQRGRADADLLLKDLDLFTSLLCCLAKLPVNHSGQVGRYVDRLSNRLGLTDEDRLTVTRAGYVHDLAKFHYSAGKVREGAEVIRLTAKLLKSLGYPPRLLEMLRCMYVSLPTEDAGGLSLGTVGGSILTIVDIFCNSIPQDGRLSLDTFHPIKEKLRGLAGGLLLPEVVEVFIGMIHEEVLGRRAIKKAVQVMVLVEDSSLEQTLELRLKSEGFGVISQSSPASFVELYKRREPEMIIVAIPGEPEKVESSVRQLAEGGVNFENTPTLVFTDCSYLPVTSLLEQGIEDVVFADDNLDLMFGRINALGERISARAKAAAVIADGTSGSGGRLAETDLIQLLKILGPSRKTVRITVQSHRPDAARLLLYLDRGQMSFARCGNLTGAEAVYEALSWSEGSWAVQSVASKDLPAANIGSTNQAILLEGCRLVDKSIKR